MSRVGKQPISIPDGIKIDLKGDVLTVRGPRGSLSRKIHPKVLLEVGNHTIVVRNADSSKKSRSLHGLTRTLISNMVEGVAKGFKKVLEISGLGLRASQKGNVLNLSLGYSHPIEFELPQGVSAKTEKTNKIILESSDNELLGIVAAKIRSLKPPEPYKGKGIRYQNETIKTKVGKSGK